MKYVGAHTTYYILIYVVCTHILSGSMLYMSYIASIDYTRLIFRASGRGIFVYDPD